MRGVLGDMNRHTGNKTRHCQNVSVSKRLVHQIERRSLAVRLNRRRSLRVPYYDAGDDAFEQIVVAICVEHWGQPYSLFLLGQMAEGTPGFKAQQKRFLTQPPPLSGTFVVQAKHTEHPFAKFSDQDFSGDSDTAIITKELPRITALVTT